MEGICLLGFCPWEDEEGVIQCMSCEECYHFEPHVAPDYVIDNPEDYISQ